MSDGDLGRAQSLPCKSFSQEDSLMGTVGAGSSFAGARLRHANASKHRHKIILCRFSYQGDPERLSFSATCGGDLRPGWCLVNPWAWWMPTGGDDRWSHPLLCHTHTRRLPGHTECGFPKSCQGTGFPVTPKCPHPRLSPAASLS